LDGVRSTWSALNAFRRAYLWLRELVNGSAELDTNLRSSELPDLGEFTPLLKTGAIALSTAGLVNDLTTKAGTSLLF
jgi:hypothetical protein